MMLDSYVYLLFDFLSSSISCNKKNNVVLAYLIKQLISKQTEQFLIHRLIYEQNKVIHVCNK